MTTPYIGFGNDTLDFCAPVNEGDLVDCDKCGESHPLQSSINADTGEKTAALMFYHCEGSTYLGAIAGKLVVGVKSDCHGEL